VELRQASEGDLKGIMAVENDCFGSERYDTRTVRAFLRRTDSFVLVAVEDDMVLGAAMCLFPPGLDEGRIASIAVLRRHRRRGIGSALLDECERILGALNLGRYVLEVDTRNRSAVRLYRKRGYVTTGRIDDFYSKGRHAFVMEKSAERSLRRVRIRPS
jgi:ribosomal protein S18 acetylase RimI-like enzyme